jgi:hypothetical protein
VIALGRHKPRKLGTSHWHVWGVGLLGEVADIEGLRCGMELGLCARPAKCNCSRLIGRARLREFIKRAAA